MSIVLQTAARLLCLASGAMMVAALPAAAQMVPPQVRVAPQVVLPVPTGPLPPPPFMQGISQGISTDASVNPPSMQATEAPVPAAGSVAEPATAPAPGKADGTAPGNEGSTGWTGGTGGSNIGTSPQGAVATSQTWQPPTARGLDLKGTPDPVAKP